MVDIVDAERFPAGDAGKSGSRCCARNVRQSRSRVAGKTQVARHSRLGGFLCAIRRFGFCDREKEG